MSRVLYIILIFYGQIVLVTDSDSLSTVKKAKTHTHMNYYLIEVF